MNTADRAHALATACDAVGSAWRPTAEQLIGLVRAELGHAEALDRFVPHGDLQTMARPVSPVLHILAGNTADAALQTLTRGLLLGTRNLVKLPASGIGEVAVFVNAMPADLRALVETTDDRQTAQQWSESAAAVIVFGDDETLWNIQGGLHPGQILLPHGHKVSIAVVDADPDGTAAALLARDIAAHDQRGCLSPHDIYVSPQLRPRSFAATIARALDEVGKSDPPGERSFDEISGIDHLRRSYAFRACSDTSVQLWNSEGSTDWTVVFEEEPQFAASPGCRFVFVKPLPDDLQTPLALAREHLSTIASHPYSPARAEQLAKLGATRICPAGEAQKPSPFWHHDGQQVLAPLVRWVDAG